MCPAVKVFQIVTPSHYIWSKYLMIVAESCFCCATGYRQVYIIGDYDGRNVAQIDVVSEGDNTTHALTWAERIKGIHRKQFSLIRGLVKALQPKEQ